MDYWLPVLSIVLSVLVIPALGLLIKWYDRKADARSERRETARSEFNAILLEGVLNIGDLSDANATVSLNSESDDAKSRLRERQKKYKEFRKKVGEFRNKQTIGTL